MHACARHTHEIHSCNVASAVEQFYLPVFFGLATRTFTFECVIPTAAVAGFVVVALLYFASFRKRIPECKDWAVDVRLQLRAYVWLPKERLFRAHHFLLWPIKLFYKRHKYRNSWRSGILCTDKKRDALDGWMDGCWRRRRWHWQAGRIKHCLFAWQCFTSGKWIFWGVARSRRL